MCWGRWIGLPGIDVVDLGSEIAQGGAEGQGRRGAPEEPEVGGEAAARALAALDPGALFGEVAADELEPDPRGEVLPDVGAVGPGKGEIVAAEGPLVLAALIGADLLAKVHQRAVEADVPPALDGLRIGEEGVGHVVGQTGQPLLMGGVDLALRLPGEGRGVEVGRRGVVGDGHVGLAHAAGAGPGLDEQEQHRGPALGGGGGAFSGSGEAAGQRRQGRDRPSSSHFAAVLPVVESVEDTLPP